MASCRKCSYCGGNGHNSRTCGEQGGVKLFGVHISRTACVPMRKSASTGNLVDTACPSACASARQDGYASEDLLRQTSCQRKKGVPWSKEEHKLFLLALHKLGKGDWRGISKHFVKTRTPTQVASHAQKHFLRQSNLSKRRRRSSLFDMAPDVVAVDEVEETVQEASSLPHEYDAVKATNPIKEVSLAAYNADMSSTLPKVQGNDEANHDFIRTHGMPLNESRQPSCPSPYMQFPGCRYPYGWDPAMIFCNPWHRLGGFPNFVQFPNTESKIVRPIPLTPANCVKIVMPMESSEMKPAIECTFLSMSKPRQSAFHSLAAADNQDTIKHRGSCNAISVS